ncbi:MAG: twin-arginine translocase TatA/TatE family subunit [Alphaproteobacteria bacterium]|nr:twin-arginine translocase TatA/TatE family subunit [Alphaproteobacteria bacterium]
MLDVAWPELLVIGAVALVAVGPEDFPKIMRSLGRWAGKISRMGKEFLSVIEQLDDEVETKKREDKKS